ncbi:hypothetical protein ACI6QG_04910 [Roseococcus sp. DSY-14]|uniref:hypothetical protein n=1 Tax=Roseococcus sp. DSY-14 TaxID=3369650 RepID=UPI00387B9669
MLAAALLAACAATEGGGGPAAPIPPASGPEALAARLPAEAAGLRRGSDTALSDPLPGREVAYATANRQAAAFVQVLRPAAPLPDGPASAAAQAEYARWKDAATGQASRNRRLAVVREAEVAGLFRCAMLEGSYGRQPVESTVCVGAAGGQLLRLRVSMPRREPAAADAQAFVREVAAALRR